MKDFVQQQQFPTEGAGDKQSMLDYLRTLFQLKKRQEDEDAMEFEQGQPSVKATVVN